MRILRVEDDTDKIIAEAIKALRSGGVIAYPTETFYALGVDANNEKALKRIYGLKGRSSRKPLPVIIGGKKVLKLLVKEIPPESKRLMEKFWPGPLTIVFKSLPEISGILAAKTGKIAIRIPGGDIAHGIAKKSGFPVTSTSANPSGRPPARDTGKVIEYFGDSIDLVIDGGRTPGGMPSTIVDVTGPLKILRKGAIPSRIVLDLD